ncbi:23S rRNA (adenine2030-N6)-methyltransferase [Modicisalibacter ilicicola DSM 19980]|uniref:Ribosomal RNA large subunit methyltransferase J n=1 Tax=Modicisalibacter ilicicola DSM 19980 TaxID=1121942 RepID=A0A1M4VTR6_9GAMM|nr:23S rRNA (adenine(2030)-N(6))-methyltransferase RlmJ [Halomonas ilicicola]SHE72193.1 23S rRNA (adenine2030-N6)-methyltransferase [Halomonas ilicicola DSM 19980]
MLAYQHAYHAGNFADVHKHLVLFAVQRNLLRKESQITYIDTHAGRGYYPLQGIETQKLKEYQTGVLPLWQAFPPSTFQQGGTLVDEWVGELRRAQGGDGSRLTHYPGSPWWLASMLRPQDRLTLFELHPGEHRHLDAQTLPSRARRLHEDGLKGLRRLLPVATPRLCVLIDPSYERKEEYAEVAETLEFVARKARHAVVLVWYPLLPAGRHQNLLDAVRQAGLRKLWRSELRMHAPDGEHGMYGSGMLLFNPPWGLDRQIEDAMGRVTTCLGAETSHQGQWWVGE